MKPTIYIAGKIEDIPRYKRADKFNVVQKEIEKKGYRTINPALLVSDISNERFAMKMRLMALKSSDAIFMMPCAVDCPDAAQELQQAIEQGIDIYSDIKDIEIWNN